MSPVVLFVDTNVFLHCRRARELDWLAATGASSAQIALAPQVLRELAKQKETGDTAKIRKRAQGVLGDFAALLRSGNPATLRAGVDLRSITKEPLLDFAAHQLSERIQDDHLLASLLEYRNENPSVDCRLVTSDLGLELKATSRGLAVIVPPDDWKLPEERSDEEKKIERLEQENRLLKSRLPVLGLEFEGGGSSEQFEPPTDSPVDELAIVTELDQVRKNHPFITQPDPASTAGTLAAIMQMGLIDPDDAAAYNARLKEFFQFYDIYLREKARHAAMLRRTLKLEILVRNSGSAPAEGVAIELHFPDGFELFDEESLPAEPEPPVPPEEPSTPIERMRNLDFITRPGYVPMEPLLRAALPSNVSSPEIRRSHSYDVKVSVVKLKHGFADKLPPFWVTFPSAAETKSFRIDYKIHAENLTVPVAGQIHVVVVKE